VIKNLGTIHLLKRENFELALAKSGSKQGLKQIVSTPSIPQPNHHHNPASNPFTSIPGVHTSNPIRFPKR